MKHRTAHIACSWAQLSLSIMAVATAGVGLLYGGICLIEGVIGVMASEGQD